MKRGILIFTLAATISAAQAQLPLPEKRDPIDPSRGPEIVKRALSQRPPKNTTLYGVMKIRDAEGRRREVPIRYRVVLNEDSWQGVYEAKDTSENPAEQLVIIRTAPDEQHYFFSRRAGATTAPDLREVEGAELFKPFAGSDFFIADLGLEFLRWPAQRLVGKQYKKSRWCLIVESVNPNPDAGGYSKVRSWIDEEFNALISAEAYDSKGKILKEFNVRSVKKVEDEYQIKELEIQDEQNYSRTQLEFHLETD